MRKTFSHRKLQAVFTGFGTAVLVIIASSVAGSAAAEALTGSGSQPRPEVGVRAAISSFQFVSEIFDGAGYGSTAESAVNQAIGDAKVTASSYQLYTCELVEEPEVFQQPPGSLRAFRAHVRMRCTP